MARQSATAKNAPLRISSRFIGSDLSMLLGVCEGSNTATGPRLTMSLWPCAEFEPPPGALAARSREPSRAVHVPNNVCTNAYGRAFSVICRDAIRSRYFAKPTIHGNLTATGFRM
jgi:hypothetical protein